MLRLVAKLLKALNSETSSKQLAAGFVFGLIIGLTPLWSLHNWILLFFALILRVNISALILSLGVFSGLAYLLDPLYIQLGEALLARESLQGLWQSMYNNTFWRLMHFNHTITLGSAVIAFALAIPAFFIFDVLIRKYREHILAWVQKLRIAQFLKASKFYGIYQKVSGVGQ